MSDLTMFVPTRGRPTAAVCLQEVFEDTCTGNTEVIFIISEDDSYCEDYLALGRLGILSKIILVSPRKRGMADPLNLGFRKWLDDPRVFPSYAVGFMGDDHRPRTQGWDTEYLRALTALSGRSRDRSKPGVGMVYGDDLLQGENLPTQVAMTCNIPTTLGRMVPDQLAHLYTDAYWLELGKALNKITYLPDVVVEHMHPGAGKANIDEGYAYSGSSSLDLSDKSLFEGIVCPLVITEDVKKIKRLI
jgi:hypothetical protein